jgi:hypothetical protein
MPTSAILLLDLLNEPILVADTDKHAVINQFFRDLEAAQNNDGTITQTNSDTFLSITSAATHPAFGRNYFFDITGSPSQDFEVIVPEIDRFFSMRNSTNQTGNIRTGSSTGTSVSLAAGEIAVMQSDGTNIILIARK